MLDLGRVRGILESSGLKSEVDELFVDAGENDCVRVGYAFRIHGDRYVVHSSIPDSEYGYAMVRESANVIHHKANMIIAASMSNRSKEEPRI